MSVQGGNILVIGSTSYIGGALATALNGAGANVYPVSSKECNLLDQAESRAFVRDLSLDGWTVIFLSVINKTIGNDFESFEKNVAIVRNFLDAAEKADLRQVIYFSSVDVYGNRPALPITEQTSVHPDTWYGLAKYNCEWMMLHSAACPVTVLRIPGVYGRVAKDRSVIGRLVSSIRQTGKVCIHGKGRSLRDYVFIGDIPKIVTALITNPHEGPINVATGRSYSIVELAKAACASLQRECEMVHEPADPGRDFDLVFDNSLIRSVIPGFEFTDLSTGLKSYA